MHFVITVDTEADNQWKKEKEIRLKNIGFLPRFQALCERYGFPPTYLVTYEVAENDEAVELLSAWQKGRGAEIGAHLHPWTTPPLSVEENEDNTIRTFPNELSDDLLRQKLEVLTDKIENKFGRRPTSFRAGRWGFDGRVAENLINLGYLVDCSISPKVSWEKYLGLPGGPGGPDFRASSAHPYYINSKDENGKILEVPMTILFTGACRKEKTWHADGFLRLPDGFMKRAANKLLFRQRWLRVLPGMGIRDWQRIYVSAVKNNLPVLEFMIHSSELMSGGSPYWKTEKSVEILYRELEELFGFLKGMGTDGITLNEFVKQYNEN